MGGAKERGARRSGPQRAGGVRSCEIVVPRTFTCEFMCLFRGDEVLFIATVEVSLAVKGGSSGWLLPLF